MWRALERNQSQNLEFNLSVTNTIEVVTGSPLPGASMLRDVRPMPPEETWRHVAFIHGLVAALTHVCFRVHVVRSSTTDSSHLVV